MTYLENSPCLGALVTSTLLSTIALATPGQAATFSSVQAQFSFNNFSHPAQTTLTNTFTDTLAISQGGEVLARGDAEAFFASGLQSDTSTLATNTILGVAAGSGRNYLGIAESTASILGDFALGANETFSFNFSGWLELDTAINDASYESAFALGFLGFSVLGPANQVYDSFSLLATLETPGPQTSLTINLLNSLPMGNQSGIQISTLTIGSQSSELDNSLFIGFGGTYRRTVSEPTLVSLGETKTGIAAVQQVPTPSLLGGILSFGWAGLVSKLRRRLASD